MMPPIWTPRLVLSPIPLPVLKTRLLRDNFVAGVAVAGDVFPATLLPEWSGLATVLFPVYIAAMETDPETVCGAAW